jgi:hypothetical protein
VRAAKLRREEGNELEVTRISFSRHTLCSVAELLSMFHRQEGN